MIEWTSDLKLKAALHEHKNQVELLRHDTALDIRVFGGFMAIQLAFGSWASTNTGGTVLSHTILLLIDVALSFLAITMLRRNSVRRREVVEVVWRLNEALGYSVKGIYLEDQPLHETSNFKPWYPYYRTGIIIVQIGIAMVLFLK